MAVKQSVGGDPVIELDVELESISRRRVGYVPDLMLSLIM